LICPNLSSNYFALFSAANLASSKNDFSCPLIVSFSISLLIANFERGDRSILLLLSLIILLCDLDLWFFLGLLLVIPFLGDFSLD
jgi:hypothetical protein